jgi:hypothetical protein
MAEILDYQDGHAHAKQIRRANPLLFIFYLCGVGFLATDWFSMGDLLDLVTTKDPWVQLKLGEALFWCACAVGLFALATYHWWVNNRPGYRIAIVAMLLVYYLVVMALQEAYRGVWWHPWYRPVLKGVLIAVLLIVYGRPIASLLRRRVSRREH